MSTKLRLYYANQLVDEFFMDAQNFTLSYYARWIHHDMGDEIYNGGYLHQVNPHARDDRAWYRCDLTPVLDADVPKELKLLTILLN